MKMKNIHAATVSVRAAHYKNNCDIHSKQTSCSRSVHIGGRTNARAILVYAKCVHTEFSAPTNYLFRVHGFLVFSVQWNNDVEPSCMTSEQGYPKRMLKAAKRRIATSKVVILISNEDSH